MADDLIVALVRFEEPIGLLFHDEAGGLDELGIATGWSTDPGADSRPQGPAGTAYRIDPSAPYNALMGVDLAVAGTLLTRDLTVQAILAWDLTNQHATSDIGTLIARGKGNVLAEYQAFGIELRVLDVASGLGEVRFFWQTSAGATKTQTGGQFIVPPANIFGATAQYFLLTCTRHWIDSTHVSLRYYVNDRLIGDVLSVDGDIGGGTNGTTSIGVKWDTGSSTFIDTNGVAILLDEIAISNYELSQQEIEATWLRISKYQPDGYRQMRELMPPGIPIADDPSTTPQADLRSMGLELGFADARIENFRDNIMPDRAYGDVLRRWENITKQPPKAVDSFDTRRARVIGQMSKHAGFTLDGVASALAPLLACAANQLQFFAFSNTLTDAFAALAPEVWSDQSAGVDVTGGRLRIQGAGATLYTFDGVNQLQRYAALPVDGPVATSMYTHLSFTAFPANCETGIVFYCWATGDYLFFGVRNTAGTIQVGYQHFAAWAAADPAFVVIATTSAVDHYLRIRNQQPLAGSITLPFNASYFALSWSTIGSSPESDFTTVSNVVGPLNFDRAAFYMRSNGALGGAADVRFANDFQLRIGAGKRPYRLYVYRDPAIPGSPDLVGAQGVLSRMKHGYTHAAVITSKSMLCDSSGSGCDLGPCGDL